VADDIHWGDVASKHQQSLLSLAESLDDLFDTALELTLLG
jgi:hypothetical protein